MYLTAEAFQRVIQTLRSDGRRQDGRRPDGSKELRRFPRAGLGGRATVLVPAKHGSESFVVNVRDVSAGGVGLLCPRPVIGVGDRFLLVLPSESRLVRLSILYVAEWVTQASADRYVVGASLVQEIGISVVTPPPAPTSAPPSPPPAAVRPTEPPPKLAAPAPVPVVFPAPLAPAAPPPTVAAPAAPARETDDEMRDRIRRAILG